MTVKIPKIDEIPVEEQTSWVLTLLECINALAEENQALRDEIARLKGEKPRPKIKPSSLEGNHKKPESSEKRPGLRCPNHHIFFAPDLEPALECNL